MDPGGKLASVPRRTVTSTYGVPKSSEGMENDEFRALVGFRWSKSLNPLLASPSAFHSAGEVTPTSGASYSHWESLGESFSHVRGSLCP